jgi:hypothetical protein
VIELAIVTGWTPDEIRRLSAEDQATVVDVIRDRARG